jgi:DNA polymerase III epsilon subunit-like protein
MNHQQVRDDATNRAKAILEHNDKIVILDSETTGLYGEIIELAIIDLEGNVLFNSLFYPKSEIEPGALAVHGITKEMLEGQPTWPDKWPEIESILYAARLVLIYNADFDIARISTTNRVHRIEERVTYRPECLMELYARWYGDWNSYHRSYRWQKLGGGHSALEDCQAALRKLQQMAGVLNGHS